MNILDVEQGSEAWISARLGLPTATGIANLLTPATLKPSVSAIPYMAKLLVEYMTGEQQDQFSTASTANGTLMEPVARKMYEAMAGNVVEEVGMIYFDDRRDRACSPDGLINREKGLEIKCPMIKTHIGYVLKDELPNDYKLQVHGCMYISNLDSWDFMSFHPEFRPLMLTIERDWDIDRAIGKALDSFCEKFANEKAKIDASRIF